MRTKLILLAVLLAGCTASDKFFGGVKEATGPTTQGSSVTNVATHTGAGVVDAVYPTLGSAIVGIASLLAAGYFKIRQNSSDTQNAGLKEGIQTIANAGIIGVDTYNQLHPVAAKIVADATKDAQAVEAHVDPAATPK